MLAAVMARAATVRRQKAMLVTLDFVRAMKWAVNIAALTNKMPIRIQAYFGSRMMRQAVYAVMMITIS